MKNKYTIGGMTCNSCEAAVKRGLESHSDIKNVKVILDRNEAVIEMKKHVSIDALQASIPNKYSISLKEKTVEKVSPNLENTEDNKTKFQQLKPLFLILFYITLASILLHIKNWNSQAVMLDFMGLFFIVFSFFKMLDLKGFPASFGMYDPLGKKVPLYGKIYPFIETGLGLMFLLRFSVMVALIATVVILGITTIGVTQTLLDKKAIKCACLGTALKLPMTEATFIENAIMIVMSIVMLINFI